MMLQIVIGLILVESSTTLAGNVLQIDVGGLSKLPVSITTKGYLKIQMFISEGK
jgi:hypothetical protein